MINYNDMKLEKINEFVWRIPREGKMRVDGIVFASEKLMESIRQDKSLEQVANVATLPGIVGASLAMPDIHWGYGAPIGGVAAFDPNEGGIIAPGMIGYDINCLAGTSEILCQKGYTISIRDCSRRRNEKIQGINFDHHNIVGMPIHAYIKIRNKKRTYVLKTLSGRQIIATEDHPFYTPAGMKELKFLQKGNLLAVYPFQGIRYKKPRNIIILSESDIYRTLSKFGKKHKSRSAHLIVGKLKKRGLLPLKGNDPKLSYLLKIMGMVFGDGSMNFIGSKKDGIVGFFGNEEDLKIIREDIKNLGYNPSRVYSRFTKLIYKGKAKKYRTYWFYVNASSLVTLLVALGVPIGTKVSQKYDIPAWIKRGPLWQKRLFLSSFFSAELSRPRPKTSKRGNFYAPVLSMCKHEEFESNGRSFLNSIAKMCREFGVETTSLVVRRKRVSKAGKKSSYFELVFSSKPASLVNLWGKIGFDYHQKKMRLACEAAQYLLLKEHVIQMKGLAIRNILMLRKKGMNSHEIYSQIGNEHVGKRFIQSVLEKKELKGGPRISGSFLAYFQFKRIFKAGLEDSCLSWDRIESIQNIGGKKWVYDFTVDHPDHNFIADGFVVANCGVRLLRTDLAAKDIEGKIQGLVDKLFHHIPVGVGKGHKGFKLSRKELERVASKGAGWAVSSGYGTKEDLAHLESQGCLDWADPSAVPDRAYERGAAQLGSVGSGNHFVEIDFVSEIYDESAAFALGLEKDQIVVQIHSGSRGFGHQTCTEYLPLMLRASEKYGIELVDRQLCCAPLASEEGKRYFGAMASAANYAFANRQMITQWVREIFEEFFGAGYAKLGICSVYDVCHNIAKWEEHTVSGKKRRLCVHRKGATRAYPKGHPELPAAYRELGQPVLIPGDMGRYSFVLIGEAGSMEKTFGSSCHGAGRMMSRHAAAKSCRGRNVPKELAERGIIVRGASMATVVEEIPEAYKDVANVVDVVAGAGLSRKVAKLMPLGVIKG